MQLFTVIWLFIHLTMMQKPSNISSLPSIVFGSTICPSLPESINGQEFLLAGEQGNIKIESIQYCQVAITIIDWPLPFAGRSVNKWVAIVINNDLGPSSRGECVGSSARVASSPCRFPNKDEVVQVLKSGHNCLSIKIFILAPALRSMYAS